MMPTEFGTKAESDTSFFSFELTSSHYSVGIIQKRLTATCLCDHGFILLAARCHRYAISWLPFGTSFCLRCIEEQTNTRSCFELMAGSSITPRVKHPRVHTPVATWSGTIRETRRVTRKYRSKEHSTVEYGKDNLTFKGTILPSLISNKKTQREKENQNEQDIGKKTEEEAPGKNRRDSRRQIATSVRA